jgi:thymidylate kinase
MIEDKILPTTRDATPAKNERNMSQTGVLDLVIKLCSALTYEQIDYCHWKSNAALDRSARGDNDLDLLVSRIHVQRFVEILYGLNFKEALAPKQDELPGVRDFYGYDLESGRLIHVHAHFQLILGNDLSKNYRLPVENIYLKSSVQGDLFRIPAPEFELVMFVIRMVLKHSTWDSILMGHGYLSPSEQQELEYLSSPDIVVKAQKILDHVPGLSSSLFENCLRLLQPGSSPWKRIGVGEQLQKVLQSSARRPHSLDLLLKFTQRVWQPIQTHFFRSRPKHQMTSGGLFISIVGGDGAGKTTLVDELFVWLTDKFEAKKLHMGKPRWSWLTIVIRGILKLGTILHIYPFEGDIYEESFQAHGLPWFIRAVCTARDRYLTYLRARRISSNGKLVICDRFSLPGFMQMDGPECERALTYLKKARWFHNLLTRIEMSYYEQIKLPDLLIVLKVKPEIAVQRKKDESEISICARTAEVWNLNWREKSTFVVDANLPKEEVLSQVKAIVWSHL